MRSFQRAGLAAALAVVAMISARCSAPAHFPGDLIGTFEFVTTVPIDVDGGVIWPLGAGPVPDIFARSTCSLAELPLSNFQFEATFSEDGGADQAWMTINGFVRPATFDGQIFESVYEAPRQYSDCTCDAGTPTPTLRETLTVALLSASQAQWVQQQPVLLDGCPWNPLDGGLPPPAGSGTTQPRFTTAGFDAVRACGVLVDIIDAGAGCSCTGCRMHFPISGPRR